MNNAHPLFQLILVRIREFIREQAHACRNAQADKDELSRTICDRFMALPEYAAAKTVLFYIDVRAEVRTRHSLPAALVSGKTIIVPWCNDRGELELFDPIGRLAEMRKDVEVGLDQMRRGQVTPADPIALLDEVERE